MFPSPSSEKTSAILWRNGLSCTEGTPWLVFHWAIHTQHLCFYFVCAHACNSLFPSWMFYFSLYLMSSLVHSLEEGMTKRENSTMTLSLSLSKDIPVTSVSTHLLTLLSLCKEPYNWPMSKKHVLRDPPAFFKLIGVGWHITFPRILSISWPLIMDWEHRGSEGLRGVCADQWVYLQLWHAANQLIW